MTDNIDAAAFYHEIHDAFTQTGCPFCRLLTRAADRYIDSLLWEMVNDPDIRQALNQARGYCHQHSWMLRRGGAALGITILMQDIMTTLLDVLKSNQIQEGAESTLKQWLNRLDVNHKPAKKLAADLSPQIACPICAKIQMIEQQYASTLLEHISGPNSLSGVYRNSAGLCLPHFRRVLSHPAPAGSVKALVEAQLAVWERLQTELSEFIRKSDYRYSHEPFGVEKDAWLRALEAIAGARPPDAHKTGLTQSI